MRIRWWWQVRYNRGVVLLISAGQPNQLGQLPPPEPRPSLRCICHLFNTANAIHRGAGLVTGPVQRCKVKKSTVLCANGHYLPKEAASLTQLIHKAALAIITLLPLRFLSSPAHLQAPRLLVWGRLSPGWVTLVMCFTVPCSGSSFLGQTQTRGREWGWLCRWRKQPQNGSCDLLLRAGRVCHSVKFRQIL